MFDTSLIKQIEGDFETYSLSCSLNNDKCHVVILLKTFLVLNESIFEVINNKYIINSMTFFNKGQKIIIVLSEK